MTVEILKDDIRLPEQNNLTWIFPVRLNGGEPVLWKVDSFDLNIWFRETVGRYPRRDRGNKDEKEDILNNWPVLEPRLRAEVEKEAQLPAPIQIDGVRTSANARNEARSMVPADLPPLSEAQRSTAKSLGVPEDAYARMIFAGERTNKELLAKTEMFTRVLVDKLRSIDSKATVVNVALRTLENRFDVSLKLNGRIVPLRVSEQLVDELFESGAPDAERRLARLLEATVGVLEQQ